MVDDAGLGEGAHVRRGVDEEDVEILQDEVEGRVLGRAEDLRHRRAEQLYADADRRLEVADRRQRVGREPHPGRILGAGEKADLEIGRQVRPHPKAAMRHPARLQEDRAQGRALTPRDAATLHHGTNICTSDPIGSAPQSTAAAVASLPVRRRAFEMLHHGCAPSAAGLLGGGRPHNHKMAAARGLAMGESR